ncbi:MAG: hypothetical protein M1818_007224 [Claussenomyces sp. TS43310]|nr:MAG: hypothetical protein M1818_007224 [Claussenomyces sp. TS43310]
MHALETLSLASLLLTAVGVLTDDHLDKPPNEPNLDYLESGLVANLPITNANVTEIANGYIPQDCVDMTTSDKLNPIDVTAYTVTYDDCTTDPWILCQHKDSNTTLDSLVEFFGQLPVQTRQWVRHVISLPDTGAHAYNSGGNIAMFDITTLTVFVHESGHSLDLLGAYFSNESSSDPESVSSSQAWLDAYGNDTDVPDPYSQSSQVENVAQNTVVASFDTNVPGGLPAINSKWSQINHQYSYMEELSANAGNLIKPVEVSNCTHRLENSALVQPGSSSRLTRFMSRAELPDISLSANVKRIPPRSFNTRDVCGQEI